MQVYSRSREDMLFEVGNDLVPQYNKFQWPGTIMEQDGRFEQDVTIRIGAGWAKLEINQ